MSHQVHDSEAGCRRELTAPDNATSSRSIPFEARGSVPFPASQPINIPMKPSTRRDFDFIPGSVHRLSVRPRIPVSYSHDYAIASTSSESPEITRRQRRHFSEHARASVTAASALTSESTDSGDLPKRQADDFSGPLAIGDPTILAEMNNYNAHRISYPPVNLFQDIAKQRDFERMGIDALKLQGLNMEEVVGAHETQCQEFDQQCHAGVPQQQAIYQMAHDRVADLSKVRERLNMIMTSNARSTNPQTVARNRNLKRGLMLEAHHLEQEIIGLANQTAKRKIEVQELITTLFDSTATITNNGAGEFGKILSQACFKDPDVNREGFEGPEKNTLLGFSTETDGPDPNARFNFGFQQGWIGVGQGNQGEAGDHRVTLKVPDWFLVFRARRLLSLMADGEVSQYRELMNKVNQLEDKISLGEWKAKNGIEVKHFDKEWHDPGTRFGPTERLRERGGWWRCRSEAGATPSELACPQCHRAEPEAASPNEDGPPSNLPKIKYEAPMSLETAKRKHKEIMDLIQQCVREFGEQDKAIVLARLRGDRTDAQSVRSFGLLDWRHSFASKPRVGSPEPATYNPLHPPMMRRQSPQHRESQTY